MINDLSKFPPHLVEQNVEQSLKQLLKLTRQLLRDSQGTKHTTCNKSVGGYETITVVRFNLRRPIFSATEKHQRKKIILLVLNGFNLITLYSIGISWSACVYF